MLSHGRVLECYDSTQGVRCWLCSAGRSCLALPASVVVPGKRLRDALRDGASASQLKSRRAAVREALAAHEAGEVAEELGEEEEEEEEEVEGETADQLPQELLARRQQVKELLGELVDLLVR